jgi:hypothetical protein
MKGDGRQPATRVPTHRRYALTAIVLHFPCLNRQTVNALRVTCPQRIAIQMSDGCSGRSVWITEHIPSGTTICETIEM